jgi:outer membrane protein assembly factor BamA
MSPLEGSGVRHSILSSLLLCWLPAMLPAQTISDIIIAGLPAGMQQDDVAAVLAEKKGAVYAKAQEPADRGAIAALLQDAGYLDAEVKSAAGFIPGGVRLTFSVTPRNLYHIEAVKTTGLSKTDLQPILDALKITNQTTCTKEACQHLSDAIAEKLNMNVLFLGMEHKLNANRHDTTLIFSR